MKRVLDLVRRRLKAKAAKLSQRGVENQQSVGGLLVVVLEPGADRDDRGKHVLSEAADC